MGRETGLPKTGGRKKGTPNKKTLGLLESLDSRGLDVVAELVQTLPDLDVNKRADILMGLMTYLYPRRKAVEMTAQTEMNLNSAPHTEETEKMSEQELDERCWQLTKMSIECDSEVCNKVLDLIEDMKKRLLIREGPDGKFRSM